MLGGTIVGLKKFILPGSDAARSLVIIKKSRILSKKYPRKAGIPAKEPLE